MYVTVYHNFGPKCKQVKKSIELNRRFYRIVSGRSIDRWDDGTFSQKRHSHPSVAINTFLRKYLHIPGYIVYMVMRSKYQAKSATAQKPHLHAHFQSVSI